ncbi:MAG: hypothetical protein L0Z46_11315 [Nitrospiraceae bacterium]|nr:hypothetical protein [Nitrospiraceae bacterium]
MRILVIGAGASIEEAKRVNAPEEYYPPTVANFAKKMWDSPPHEFFNYWLPDYLADHGIDPGSDPTSVFIELAKDPDSKINVERLFEYCWENRGKKFQTDWENLIYHGVLNPLNFLLLMAFYENGAGIKELHAGQLVSGKLQDGDLALNLNYDTLFEIAATQLGLQITYVPNEFTGKGILVAKPHGSINLLADERSFWFAQPDCIGALPSSADNYRNYRAIVPPRFNKSYDQHPIARIILDNVAGLRPDIMTFWGVGLADSDVDLIDLYTTWLGSTSKIEVINPDYAVAHRAEKIFKRNVEQYTTIEEWLVDKR